VRFTVLSLSSVWRWIVPLIFLPGLSSHTPSGASESGEENQKRESPKRTG